MTNRRTSIVMLVVLVSLLVPLPVAGQGMSQRESAVCEQITERLTAVREKFDAKQAALEQRAAGVSTSAELRRSEIDEVMTETQVEFDRRYQAWYESYIDEASDEGKRAAATTFYEELQRLLAARHEAYAAARKNFRTQVDQFRDQRFQIMQLTADTFRTQTEEAFAALDNGCAEGTRDNKQIRTDFVWTLRDIRLLYAEERRNQMSYKDQIYPLIEIKNNAFKEAQAEFEQGFQNALSALRQADQSL